VRRLFSTFAHGPPGIGLLVMRLGAGSALIGHSCAGLAAGASLGSGTVQALSALLGLLLVAGLWTPVAGVLAAATAAWNAYASVGDAEFHALIGATALALALLGPGAWSIDARRFGMRQIKIPNGRQKRQ
jgi:putative oxidoreductase